MSLSPRPENHEYCFHFLFTACLLHIHSFYYRDHTFSHSLNSILNPLKYILSILACVVRPSVRASLYM